MKMLSSLLLPVSTALLCLEQVYAWSQYQHFGHRVMNTVLRLRDNENDDVDYERSRLETLFADHVTDFHNDLAPLISNVEQMKNLPVNDWMGSSNAFDNEWADTGACYEDECDQCEIPADFKDDSVRVDVLDFLGISRAEPLRVQKRP